MSVCHVKRGLIHNHTCAQILAYKDSQWILHRRSEWVPENSGSNSRNSILAGRTGTRLNIGRPQQRWDQGVLLAKTVLEGRTMNLNQKNALTIGTQIRNALQQIRATVTQVATGSHFFVSLYW